MKSLLAILVFGFSIAQAQSVDLILGESLVAMEKIGHNCEVNEVSFSQTATDFTLQCPDGVGGLELTEIKFFIDRKLQVVESQVVTIGAKYPYEWTCTLKGNLGSLFQAGLTLKQECQTFKNQ